VSWLRPSPQKRIGKLRPWQAPTLSESGADISGLTYVVVEEIVGQVAGLSLSAWPAADQEGRLRFPMDDDPVEVSVNIPDFCEFLNESLKSSDSKFVSPKRDPDRLGERQLRIGAAFAVEIRRPEARTWTKPFSRWVKRIHDITADARYVAKLATYGALADHWDQETANKLDLVGEPDES
jgi:hypothetical protein